MQKKCNKLAIISGLTLFLSIDTFAARAKIQGPPKTGFTSTAISNQTTLTFNAIGKLDRSKPVQIPSSKKKEADSLATEKKNEVTSEKNQVERQLTRLSTSSSDGYAANSPYATQVSECYKQVGTQLKTALESYNSCNNQAKTKYNNGIGTSNGVSFDEADRLQSAFCPNNKTFACILEAMLAECKTAWDAAAENINTQSEACATTATKLKQDCNKLKNELSTLKKDVDTKSAALAEAQRVYDAAVAAHGSKQSCAEAVGCGISSGQTNSGGGRSSKKIKIKNWK